MPKITKQEFDSLYDENISKKEYDRIINLIDVRFVEICKHIMPKVQTRGWFDYGNLDYYSEESHGFFDPQEYKKYIEIGGEFAVPPMPYKEFGDLGEAAFPTRWLWEDFEDEFAREVKDYDVKLKEKIEKEKHKKQTLKEKRKLLQAQIKNKLTKEELSVISFK